MRLASAATFLDLVGVASGDGAVVAGSNRAGRVGVEEVDLDLLLAPPVTGVTGTRRSGVLRRVSGGAAIGAGVAGAAGNGGVGTGAARVPLVGCRRRAPLGVTGTFHATPRRDPAGCHSGSGSPGPSSSSESLRLVTLFPKN